MSFDKLILKVKQAEEALEASERRTAARWKQLKIVWKEGWTPGRIVMAGLVSGFLVGRSKPLRLASGGGVLNLVTALSGLMASGSAKVAAEEAGQAAEAAIASAPDAAVSQVAQVGVAPAMDTFDA